MKIGGRVWIKHIYLCKAFRFHRQRQGNAIAPPFFANPLSSQLSSSPRIFNEFEVELLKCVWPLWNFSSTTGHLEGGPSATLSSICLPDSSLQAFLRFACFVLFDTVSPFILWTDVVCAIQVTVFQRDQYSSYRVQYSSAFHTIQYSTVFLHITQVYWRVFHSRSVPWVWSLNCGTSTSAELTPTSNTSPVHNRVQQTIEYKSGEHILDASKMILSETIETIVLITGAKLNQRKIPTNSKWLKSVLTVCWCFPSLWQRQNKGMLVRFESDPNHQHASHRQPSCPHVLLQKKRQTMENKRGLGHLWIGVAKNHWKSHF